MTGSGKTGKPGRADRALAVAGDIVFAISLLFCEACVLGVLLFTTGIEQWADPDREPSNRVLVGAIVLAVLALIAAVALGGRRMPVTAAGQVLAVLLLGLLIAAILVERRDDTGPGGEQWERTDPHIPPCYSGSDCSRSGG
jgi:peptidoglycan/LPS O-acetylase OafA/YrhL